MRLRHLPLLLLAAGAMSAQEPAVTLVPADARIDDRAATLALVEALFAQPATRAEAVTRCTAWLARHPDDVAFTVHLARLETWAGQSGAAIARLEALAAAGTLPVAGRAALIEAYLEAGRPADAIRESDALLASLPDPDAAAFATAGEARFRAGQPEAAVPFFQRALARDPAHAAARRSLALALAYSGQTEDALPLLEDLARTQPDDLEVTRALVGLARQPEAAARLVDLVRARAERDPDNAELLVAWAELETGRGHVLAARDLYRRALAKALPVATDDFALRFARARRTWGDFYGAEHAFRKALERQPSDAAVRADLINLLIAMDRLDEAAVATDAWLAEAPNTPAARAARAEIARKQHAPVVDIPVTPATPAPGSVAAAFAAAGKSAVRTSDFVHALTGGADDFQARGQSLPAGTVIPQSAPRLQQWSGQYAAHGDFGLAIRCLRAARLADPDYFPAWLDLAEFLAIDGQFAEADREFAALAAALPESRQVLLKQARALGWGRRFQESLDAYTALRALNPADPVPLLEQARVAGWAKRRGEASGLYGLIAAEKSAFQVPPSLREAFRLENLAKQQAWDREWGRAAATYEELLALTPGNQEAIFDYAQVRAAQGLGQLERGALGRLLELDANNRLAGKALFRRDRRSAPLLYAAVEAYREKGRDDLSSIRRLGTSVGGELLRDDRFRLSAAWRTWREKPDTRAVTSRAAGFTLAAEGVLNDWLAASADYTHKDADEAGANIADTGGAQGWISFPGGQRLGAGVEVREELANAFALARGVRSTHTWIGGTAGIGRRFEIEARAADIGYSDANGGQQFWIAPAYTWTDHPRTFKTTLTFEARDTDHANIYRYAGPTLVDITHPYWTPQSFRGTTLTLEWRHDLATDYFIGAAERWYDIRVSFTDGNDGNQGFAAAFDWAREWRDRWVARVGLALTRTQEWDDQRVQVRLARRF